MPAAATLGGGSDSDSDEEKTAVEDEGPPPKPTNSHHSYSSSDVFTETGGLPRRKPKTDVAHKYAPLFGYFNFHTKIPLLRRLWRFKIYRHHMLRRGHQETRPSPWNDQYEIDYPLNHFFSKIRLAMGLSGALLSLVFGVLLSLLRLNWSITKLNKKPPPARRSSNSSYTSETELESGPSNSPLSQSRVGSRYYYRRRRRRGSRSGYGYPGVSNAGPAAAPSSARSSQSRRPVRLPRRLNSAPVDSDNESDGLSPVRPPGPKTEGRLHRLLHRRKKKTASPDTEMGGRRH